MKPYPPGENSGCTIKTMGNSIVDRAHRNVKNLPVLKTTAPGRTKKTPYEAATYLINDDVLRYKKFLLKEENALV